MYSAEDLNFEQNRIRRQRNRITVVLSTTLTATVLVFFFVLISEQLQVKSTLESTDVEEFQVIGWTEEQVEEVERKLTKRVQKLSRAFRVNDGKTIYLRSKIAQAQAHLEALEALHAENLSIQPDINRLYQRAIAQWAIELSSLRKQIQDAFEAIKTYDSSQDDQIQNTLSNQLTFPDWRDEEVAKRILADNELDREQSQLDDDISASEREYLALISARVHNLTDKVQRAGQAVTHLILDPGGLWDQHDRAFNDDLAAGLEAARRHWAGFINETARPIAAMEATLPDLVSNVTAGWARLGNSTAALARAARNDTAVVCRAVWEMASQVTVDSGRIGLLLAAVQRLGDGRQQMADPCNAARALALRVDSLISVLLQRLAAESLYDAEAGRGVAASSADYYNVSARWRLAQWRSQILDTAAAAAAHRRMVQAAAVEGGLRILNQVRPLFPLAWQDQSGVRWQGIGYLPSRVSATAARSYALRPRALRRRAARTRAPPRRCARSGSGGWRGRRRTGPSSWSSSSCSSRAGSRRSRPSTPPSARAV